MEFNVDITKGYYRELTDECYAQCITIPTHDHFMRLLNDHFCALDTCDDPNLEFEKFEKMCQTFINPEFSAHLNFINEEDVAGQENDKTVDVGYIYLRATINQLLSCPMDTHLYLRLMAPQDTMVCMLVSPRRLGDLLRLYSDIDPDVTIRYNITIPHPVHPGQVIAMQRNTSNTITTLFYELRCEDLLRAGNILDKQKEA